MECIDEAHRLKNNFDIAESEFKSTLMKILVDIRTGKCDPSTINDALSDFLSSSHSPAAMAKNISKFEDQVEGAQSNLLNGLARYASIIDYGIDDGFFYCKCGGAKHTDVEFKCNDTKHGLQCVAYEQVLFREVLSKLRMTKEINIHSGGNWSWKSTWINALANYLAFQTLNDAKESDDIKVLIPTQFSYTSETGKSQQISVGSKSLNEVLVTGHSATQGPKAYRFFVGKHVISLIDTPGIGDVRGLEQDEKNFESILAHLSYLMKFMEFVMNETSRTVYKQQCHTHCYLSGIPTECTNNANLQHCWAMNGGNNPSCHQCGHSWKVHMHMTYDLNPVNKSVIDEHVQSLLTEKQDDASRLQSFIQHVKIYCEELKQEQQEITDISAQLGCYLKKNAITPYNDEVDAHLRMMIEGEKRKPDISQKTIDHLTEMRHKYDQKKQIIMKAMASPEKTDVDVITDPDKVEELKTKLFHLKHNGQSLRNIFEDIQKVRNQYHYSEAQMEPIRVVKNQSNSGGLYESIVGTFKSAKSAFKNLFRS
eukprot:gene2498-biopygen1368